MSPEEKKNVYIVWYMYLQSAHHKLYRFWNFLTISEIETCWYGRAQLLLCHFFVVVLLLLLLFILLSFKHKNIEFLICFEFITTDKNSFEIFKSIQYIYVHLNMLKSTLVLTIRALRKCLKPRTSSILSFMLCKGFGISQMLKKE